MLAPGENRILNCEQCGAPLSTAVGAEGCLNCLLSAGIAPDDAEEISPPFESGTRFYQHYEILTRPDGSRWELGRGAMGVTYKALLFGNGPSKSPAEAETFRTSLP